MLNPKPFNLWHQLGSMLGPQHTADPWQQMIKITSLGSHPFPSISKVGPRGKHTENYGKSQFLIGKFTINGDFP